MSDRRTDAPASDGPPDVPAAGTAGGGPPTDAATRVRSRAAAAGRRAAAFEAGRHFHRARVGVCDLAFRPGSPAPGRWNGVVARGLLAAVAAMSSPADGGVGRSLELWLDEQRGGACSGERSEWLMDIQFELDQMCLDEKWDFNLVKARNDVVQVYLDAFDAKREEVCADLPGTLAGTFRLGELVESGALPDAVFAPPVFAEERPVPAQAQPDWPYGRQAADRGARTRLVLAPPRRRRFDLSWDPTWPARVRREWAALGLPEPPEGVWPGTDGRPEDRAGRRRLVDGLAAHAARLFGEPYAASRTRRAVRGEPHSPRPPPGRRRFGPPRRTRRPPDHDRRPSTVVRRPFLILQALVNAPSNQLTKAQLRKLECCKGMEVSKELAKLPADLNDIIKATGGPTSFYHFLLPALPDAEG